MQDGQKLIPSVTRVFSKQRDMYVYLQAYEHDLDADGKKVAPATVKPMVAYVTFFKGTSKVMETPPLKRPRHHRTGCPLHQAQLRAEHAEARRIQLSETVLDPQSVTK